MPERRIDDIGISMGQETRLILGRFYSIGWETSRRIFVVWEEDWQNGKRHPGQIIYGQNSGRMWEEMLSWRRRQKWSM